MTFSKKRTRHELASGNVSILVIDIPWRLGASVMSAVVYVFPQSGPKPGLRSNEPLSGQVVRLEPYRVLREFSDQWQAYLRAHFSSIADVALAFGVTERAARRWWNGAGPRVAFVAIALRLHPASAPAFLLGDAPAARAAA